MADNKTRKTGGGVEQFLAAVEHPRRRDDSLTLLALMKRITGLEPEMWGPSIVGFGSYHYRYDTGREGDMPLTGFSPRKQSLTVYIMPGFAGYEDLLGRLGKHRTGVACLYINKLADVDRDVLTELISRSFAHMRHTHG